MQWRRAGGSQSRDNDKDDMAQSKSSVFINTCCPETGVDEALLSVFIKPSIFLLVCCTPEKGNCLY